MKRKIILLVALGWSYMLYGQTAADALRYSFFDVEGTARTMGVGGGISAQSYREVVCMGCVKSATT